MSNFNVGAQLNHYACQVINSTKPMIGVGSQVINSTDNTATIARTKSIQSQMTAHDNATNMTWYSRHQLLPRCNNEIGVSFWIGVIPLVFWWYGNDIGTNRFSYKNSKVSLCWVSACARGVRYNRCNPTRDHQSCKVDDLRSFQLSINPSVKLDADKISMW